MSPLRDMKDSMKHPQNVVSKGDMVEVDSSHQDFESYPDKMEGEVVDKEGGGCRIRLLETGETLAFYWREIDPFKFRCGQHGKKIYHESKGWICPFC